MSTLSTRLSAQAPQLTDPADIEVAVVPLRDRLEAVAVQYRQALTAIQVRDVGEVNQIRAGRVLTVADFTAMGLGTPVGLFNLSGLTNLGSGGALVNKGTVPFGTGIMGAAASAAVFAGSTAQALYIADTGAADPFRIKTGSYGCWFRTAKRGVTQDILSKAAASNFGWLMELQVANTAVSAVSADGSNTVAAAGVTDVCDDRWHHLVSTFDGSALRLFVNGVLEGSGALAGTIFAGAAALTIGGRGDTTAVPVITNPHYGRVDEAFVTADVLSADQVRNLYCGRIAHTLLNSASVALAPNGSKVNVRRPKRGGPLATTDFPSQPVRLHNFTANTLTDQGSGNVALAAVAGGTIVSVAGADGAGSGAYQFAGAHTGLGATDTGLPAGTTSRSYGLWFKLATVPAGSVGLLNWGTTLNTNECRLSIGSTGGINCVNGSDAITGPFVADGQWHFAVAVEDNAPTDGVKRKLYLDGRLVGASTVLVSVVLGGANKFRIGALVDGTGVLAGTVDGAFVHSVALTPEQVHALYNVGSQALAASPKAEGDHIETMETTGVLAVFDTLEGCDQVDMLVLG